MAPKTRISREMILQAAFEIVRDSGIEALNVRAVAERLDCSTQPVLYQFRTMEEIHEAVYRMADEFHTGYLMSGAETGEDPFLSIGLAYIRFGNDEKHLFRFLFQTDKFAGLDMNALLSDPELAPILAAAEKELDRSGNELKELFWTLFVAVHGYAALLANNSMVYDENQAEKTLRMLFEGMHEETLREK